MWVCVLIGIVSNTNIATISKEYQAITVVKVYSVLFSLIGTLLGFICEWEDKGSIVLMPLMRLISWDRVETSKHFVILRFDYTEQVLLIQNLFYVIFVPKSISWGLIEHANLSYSWSKETLYGLSFIILSDQCGPYKNDFRVLFFFFFNMSVNFKSLSNDTDLVFFKNGFRTELEVLHKLFRRNRMSEQLQNSINFISYLFESYCLLIWNDLFYIWYWLIDLLWNAF